MATDWKDILAGIQPENDDNDGAPINPTPQDQEPTAQRLPKLSLFFEKKGRAGKQATIITGFPTGETGDRLCNDTARTLKQRIGCGGSARGGEILLQGDRREIAAKLLKDMGFRI